MCSLDLVPSEKSRMQKKLSETLSLISSCHCQEQLLESNSEIYEKKIYFLCVSCPLFNTKGAPDLQTSLLHGITPTKRDGLPSEDGLNCFHAAHSMWNSFKHKQALFSLTEWCFMLLSGLKGRSAPQVCFPVGTER